MQSETAPPNLCHHAAFAGSKEERKIFRHASTRNCTVTEEEEEEEKKEEEVEESDNARTEENANNISNAGKLSVEIQEVRRSFSRTSSHISILSAVISTTCTVVEFQLVVQ